MMTVNCDHCTQEVDKGFPAGVSVKLGKRVEYRFHLCDECMAALDSRVLGFLEFPPKTFVSER